jgi:hypothetical protein
MKNIEKIEKSSIMKKRSDVKTGWGFLGPKICKKI